MCELKLDRIRDRLFQIRESVELIEERVGEIAEPADFLTTPKGVFVFDACVLRLQVIGENVKRILDESENPLEKYCEIPWRAIVSLRNIISHEYANVDEEIVFQVIKDDLPKLKAVVGELLRTN